MVAAGSSVTPVGASDTAVAVVMESRLIASVGASVGATLVASVASGRPGPGVGVLTGSPFVGLPLTVGVGVNPVSAFA